jgi:hypothetical protein
MSKTMKRRFTAEEKSEVLIYLKKHPKEDIPDKVIPKFEKKFSTPITQAAIFSVIIEDELNQRMQQSKKGE